MRRAWIASIMGQDESYLTEPFLLKGYKVHEVIRLASVVFNAMPHEPGAGLFFDDGDLSHSTASKVQKLFSLM
jgi:GDP-D-mannose dehydratase